MGKIGEIMLTARKNKYAHNTQGKLYIFGKRKISSFQKYIYYLALIRISPIFPSTLVPFWHGRNHMSLEII